MSNREPPGEYIEYGLWLERGVDRGKWGPVDIVRCPAFGDDWQYELQPGMTGPQIGEAVRMYQYGFGKGVTFGRDQLAAELRKLIGLSVQTTEGQTK